MSMMDGVYKHTLVQLIKIFVIFSFFAVSNSFLQVFVISQNEKILEYQSQIEILEKEISRTKVEIASLQSFDRIQAIALNELGMRTANTEDYRWVEAMPMASENTPVYNHGSSEIAKADLGERLYRWLGDFGKTMACPAGHPDKLTSSR